VNWRAWVSEPLVHFLALGACLFAAFALWGRSDVGESNRIVVTRGTIDSLRQSWQQTWGRDPTSAELDALIEDHVREEILYREAVALGLDRDDTIVRRRLRQKVEFLYEDLTEPPEPTDVELEAYLEAHEAEYRIEPRYTFAHVYLSASRGSAAAADAAHALAELRRTGANAVGHGDSFLLGRAFDALPRNDVERIFGGTLASALDAAALGEWSGPFESGYGLHVVRLSERAPGRRPTLDEVRAAVRRDWEAARRRDANETMIRELRERYVVVMDTEASPRTEGP
jgi:PPIC-type PPIASE domain